ncbi:uncharacterized protein LOC112600492 [Melanaphis sacchari]|uniref:uncharacterized protein LOC112600492 n=1 Tax=Melanaphis sacchari TaxID=742174 RepID=UPI000DC13363|nr:uncharacterized protein LOC112600492 [Melanaphis sacchari]
MSVITKSLHENQNTNSYLSFDASQELEIISRMWSRSIRENIALEPYQILQVLILEINGIKYHENATLYEIKTVGVGYKPFDDSLLEIFILARFERIYSKLIIPEWNVTQFNILRMKQISTS